jgi:hypothetical protein
VLAYAANSYFDTLEGDDSKIAAFADDCVRHENGYPNPDTPQGKEQLRFSMLTCSQQIDSKIFAYMKHIRPRHALIIDRQKGVATMFVLFVHDGTRRGAPADVLPPRIPKLSTIIALRPSLLFRTDWATAGRKARGVSPRQSRNVARTLVFAASRLFSTLG